MCELFLDMEEIDLTGEGFRQDLLDPHKKYSAKFSLHDKIFVSRTGLILLNYILRTTNINVMKPSIQ